MSILKYPPIISIKPIFHCDAKYLASGVDDGQCPRPQNFVLGIHVGILQPTRTPKFASPPTQNLKFALPPTPTPDISQWNIGGIGSSGVGNVYYMYISCCLCIIFRISYARISRCKGRFQWNMGLNVFAVNPFCPTFPCSEDRGTLRVRQ